ncbi:MAG: S8 family serine peptidase, partial [Flavobacteriales bacterium]|nr:S8 family serine peptidase [Flavobacteriales bacterium]
MKKLVFLLFIICYSISSFSQENRIVLKSGTFKTDYYFDLNISDNDNYRMLFFNQIPNQKQKNELQKLGVEFLYYLPKNIYVVSFSQNISENQLKKYNIISVVKIKSEYKIDYKIQSNNFPKWALKNNKLYIKLLLFKDVIIPDVLEEIRVLSESIEDLNEFSNSVTISIIPSNLNLFSELNYVSYIEAIDPPSEKENNEGRTLHRSNVINTNFSTGRHYDGSGINIMMQDDGVIGPHVDYNGRVDQSNCSGCSTSNSNDHGDHVAGTIMGAGNIDPQAAGMANGAFLYVYSSSNNNYYDVPTIYQNNDVIITSKSYSNGCNAGYTSLSQDLDEQIVLYPSLSHVFSAGNDGNSDCGYGAGSNWGNVTGGHKQAKNVIAVANLNGIGDLASSSSRGPAADGRIKPDIAAKGTSVWSTIPSYSYGNKTGT